MSIARSELVAIGDRRDDLVAGRGADRGDRVVVGRLGERDDELAVVEVDGQRQRACARVSAGISVGASWWIGVSRKSTNRMPIVLGERRGQVLARRRARGAAARPAAAAAAARLRRARARGRHARARDGRRASLRTDGLDWRASDDLLRRLRRLTSPYRRARRAEPRPDRLGSSDGSAVSAVDRRKAQAATPRRRRTSDDDAEDLLEARSGPCRPCAGRRRGGVIMPCMIGDLLDVLGRAALDDQPLDLLGDRASPRAARTGPGSRSAPHGRAADRPGTASATRRRRAPRSASRASTSSASVGWYGSLHLSHSRRASRWATTQSSALRRRGTARRPSRRAACGVDAASLVCSVESTRWPVSAASIAMLRGLAVADLTDEHDVGVGTQDRAQRRRRTSGRPWG